MRFLVPLLFLALSAPVFAQLDTKGLADGLMREIREEHFDGERYGDLEQTCRVLDAMARSPRRYNELDGPFFRRPAEWVARQTAGSTEADAWRVLALAPTLSRDLSEARDESLAALFAQHPGRPGGFARELVRRTFGNDPVALASPDSLVGLDPAVAMLVAADPSMVDAPPHAPLAGWLRWARAARLRGVAPTDLPVLPEPGPDADLPSLLEALDMVILLHGLQPKATSDSGPPLPDRHDGGRDVDVALRGAWDYLESHQSDGTFGLDTPGWSGAEPGITALSLSAAIYLAERLDEERPAWINRGLDYLVSLQRDDGSIHETGLAVYTTSVAIEALLDGGRPEDLPVVERARRFLLTAQADEGEGYTPDVDPHYGGIGYGGDERPDLSNTQMALEAAARAGTPSDDPFFNKAMAFLTRCQNHAESQSWSWARKEGGRYVPGTDGGATYMPGNSPAGEDEAGEDLWQARSYGSMTFGLTKSYLLCGLDMEDDRLGAAVRWMADNWELESNPGFADPAKGGQGLFYYYMALGRTLAMLPDETFSTRDGQPIPWREELIQHLVDEQRITGSWVNDKATRWWEGSPGLCTPYAVLALKAANA